MSRKSKKGFKRLENHELTEFTTLNGGGAGDSESEDLLDLTGAHEHEAPDRCNSCCCWSTCLYLVLLTFLVAILGVFCGYLMYNVWQIDTNTSDSHRQLKDQISVVQAHLDELRKGTDNQFMVIRVHLGAVNGTVTQLWEEARKLSADVASLESRLTAIESQPQEKLIKQVDTIHQEMSVLNRNMNLLNHSLEDVQEMRERVASMGSVMDSYDSTFLGYQRQIGDIAQANTDIKNDVIAAEAKIKMFGDQLSEVKNTITTSHDKMSQSDDLLSAQLTQLQSLVSGLNDTLGDEVERVWTNLTKVESFLEVVEDKLSSVEEKLSKNNLPLASTQPPLISPVTQQPNDNNMEPTQPSPNTVTTASNIDSPASSTAAPPVNVSSTGDSQNTNVPTGEPTTPLTESTESRGTGATGDVPQTEGPAVLTLNVSSEASEGEMASNGSIISTEGDGGVATMEGATSSTTVEEGTLSPESEELEDEKNTNEQAIAALQSYIDNFDSMDVDFDNKLSRDEMINAGTDSKIFMLLDSDDDGYVTNGELQHMMNVLQAKHDSLVENGVESSNVFH